MEFLAKHPHCRVFTCDCYSKNAVIPASIKNQTTFFPICIGDRDETIDGHAFMSYRSYVKFLGLQHRPTALKMDIEGGGRHKEKKHVFR